MIVRRATLDDLAAISTLSRQVFIDTFVDAFAIAYDLAELEVFLARKHGEAAFAAVLADPAYGIWVCEADGALAGYAFAGPMTLPHSDARPEDGELHRLYVGRAFHGSGVGAALMERALADRPFAWIGVWSGNLRAQRFYARYGFEKAGEYDYPVGRTLDREFILRRKPH